MIQRRTQARSVSLTYVILLGLAVAVLPHVPPAAGQSSEPWIPTCVDCPKLVRDMGPHCLRIDPQGHPHLIYGGDDLYYAFHDGATWHVETIDALPGTVAYPSLALASDGTPHASYAVAGRVMHAWRDPLGWHTETIDETGNLQPQTAIAVDSHGFPIVAYSIRMPDSSRQLALARQDATGWQVATPLGTETQVGWLSLVLDENDFPHVSYVLFWIDYIKYAYQDAAGWHVEAVETHVSSAHVQWSTSLALGPDGRPWIAYVLRPDTVKVAYRDVTGWRTEIVDTGKFASLAIDVSGTPHLSYVAATGLIHSTRDAAGWHSQVVDPDTTLGVFTSIALDSDSTARVATFDNATVTLRHARLEGLTWIVETVDTAADVGKFSSLALDTAGQAHVGYYDATREAVKYAYQDTSGWRDEAVDLHAASYNGQTNLSLALDGQGVPHISYPDASTGSLKYAHRTPSGWQIETIDTQTDARMQVSLALDSEGVPRVAYSASSQTATIFYAIRDATGWRVETVSTRDVCPNAKPALALDRAGGPHISFMATIAYVRTIMIATSSTATGAWDVEAVASAIGADTSPAIALDANSVVHLAWSTPGSSSAVPHGVVRHAMREGTGWRIEVVDAGRLIPDCALALDSDGHPFIALLDSPRDAGAGQLRLAYRDAAGWHVEDLDAPNEQPGWVSLAVGHNGRPSLSYYDAIGGDLRILDRASASPIASTPPASLPWQTYCIDCPRAFDSMADHSLRLDSQGQPHVAYGGDHLYFASYDGSRWRREVVDTSSGVGLHASLALDSNGAPIIGYYDAVRGDLKLAWNDGGGWQTETVDDHGNVGAFTSMALDAAGQPHLSYFDASHQRLRYATRDAMGWHFETVTEVALPVVMGTSLALAADGQPHVAYAADGVWHAYRDSTGWHVEAIDETQGDTTQVSLVLDGTGQAHIAYGGSERMRYAFQDATGWHVETLAVGKSTPSSLAMDSVGAPHISFRFRSYGAAKFELRYVTRDTIISAWRTETIDASAGLSDGINALALDPAGVPQVVYAVDSILMLAGHGPQGGWHFETIDESTWASGSDLALDSSGRPHVSYLTGGARAGRWYATWDGERWQSEQVVATLEQAAEATGQSGTAGERAISIGGDGAPHLSYTTNFRNPNDPDANRIELWYAHKDLATGQWSIERPDPWSGGSPSLALDAAGVPCISYGKSYRWPYYATLRYTVRCGNTWCGEEVDSMGPNSAYSLGVGSSLALDAGGQPSISYLGADDHAENRQMRLAHKDAVGWQVEVVDRDVDSYTAVTSLALDAAGRTMIAYAKNYDLMLAVKQDDDWHIEVVDNAGNVTGSIVLVLNSQGQPHVGYFNGDRPRYAVRDAQGWQIQDVGPAELAACCTSGFALGPGDTPVFALTDATGKDFVLVTPLPRSRQLWLPGVRVSQ